MVEELSNSQETCFIELPMPTPWPMVAAFSIVLLFSGLVTHLVVSLAGSFCAVIACIGWFLEVFPKPLHETVEVESLEKQSTSIQKVDLHTSSLTRRDNAQQYAGKYCRVSIPAQTHLYSSGVLGGIAGGIAM